MKIKRKLDANITKADNEFVVQLFLPQQWDPCVW